MAMQEASQIWRSDQKLKRANPGFTEHVLKGYKGLVISQQKIQDLSKQVQLIQVRLPKGAQVLILQPKSKLCGRTLVSLHGGPESFESTEIRYLGLYRDLLRQGWIIQILNYRGSSCLPRKVSKTAWKNWGDSICSDFRDLAQLQLPGQKISILGASFGGALACHLAHSFHFDHVVLLSPLLDLNTQISRASRNYQAWFQTRFSMKDRTDFSLIQLTSFKRGKVLCIGASRDRVLGSQSYFYLRKKILAAEFNWTLLIQNCGHAPMAFRVCHERYQAVFDFLKEQRKTPSAGQ